MTQSERKVEIFPRAGIKTTYLRQRAPPERGEGTGRAADLAEHVEQPLTDGDVEHVLETLHAANTLAPSLRTPTLPATAPTEGSANGAIRCRMASRSKVQSQSVTTTTSPRAREMPRLQALDLPHLRLVDNAASISRSSRRRRNS